MRALIPTVVCIAWCVCHIPVTLLAQQRPSVHRHGLYLPGFRTAAGNPVLLEEVLVRHPKLRLCVDNAGYPYRGEMIAMMFQYPQLHADVSRIS